MKMIMRGDRKRAICHRDGRVTAVFVQRDVSFRDELGVARNVLVGACELCGDAILIPAQSTPVIAATWKMVELRLADVQSPANF